MKSLLAVLGLATMVAAGGVAHANGGAAGPNQQGPAEPDIGAVPAQNLLTALRHEGMSYSQPNSVIKTAVGLCQLMGEGRTKMQVVDSVLNGNPSLNDADAEKFVTLTEQLYCPSLAPPPEGGGPPGAPPPPPGAPPPPPA